MAELIYDLVVIGGGPAGTAAAITAARRGARVLLLERGRFPRHKVCGEFVSPEARNLLTNLLAEQMPLCEAARVSQVRLFLDGSAFTANISPAASSVSRYDLDAALWRAAEASRAECRQQTTADEVIFTNGRFVVMSSAGQVRARAVIDSSGRWSSLNGRRTAGRGWLGLKTHFQCTEEQETTDLYFFRRGYCGVQPAARGTLNVCAMVRADMATTLAQVFSLHPRLADVSRGWRSSMETIATFPLIFSRPTPDRNGVLCAGDAAGFIDPFAGDGIALALRTGVAAVEALCDADWNIGRAVQEYRATYHRRFAPIFRNAAWVRRLLTLPALVRAPFLPMLNIPAISKFLVRSTRGA